MLLLCLWGTAAVSGCSKDFVLPSSCVGSNLQWPSCNQVFKRSHWCELCKGLLSFSLQKAVRLQGTSSCRDFGVLGAWRVWNMGWNLIIYLRFPGCMVKVLSAYFWNSDLSASVTGCHLPKGGPAWLLVFVLCCLNHLDVRAKCCLH